MSFLPQVPPSNNALATSNCPSEALRDLANEPDAVLNISLNRWQKENPRKHNRLVPLLFAFNNYLQQEKNTPFTVSSSIKSKRTARPHEDPDEVNKQRLAQLIIRNIRIACEEMERFKPSLDPAGNPLISVHQLPTLPSEAEMLTKNDQWFLDVNNKHNELGVLTSNLGLSVFRDRGRLWSAIRIKFFQRFGVEWKAGYKAPEATKRWWSFVIMHTRRSQQQVEKWMNFAAACQNWPRLVYANVSLDRVTEANVILTEIANSNEDVCELLRGDVGAHSVAIHTDPQPASTGDVVETFQEIVAASHKRMKLAADAVQEYDRIEKLKRAQAMVENNWDAQSDEGDHPGPADQHVDNGNYDVPLQTPAQSPEYDEHMDQS